MEPLSVSRGAFVSAAADPWRIGAEAKLSADEPEDETWLQGGNIGDVNLRG